MSKRLLDCTASELRRYGKQELLEAIAASEGRVLACETIGITPPLLADVTNAEYAASLSADLLLLNMFDVNKPVIQALPKVPPEETVRELKRLTGRVIGINLEPVDPEKARDHDGTLVQMTAVGGELILAAGKMHGAGVLRQSGSSIMTRADAQAFLDAGADVILVPAPGTVPGITMEAVHDLAESVHSRGGLLMTAIGTSQEGADTATIRQIALMCKMAGADIHHIGDTGVPGMALPQNILAYSIAIRGERHTYHRMALSVNR